MLVVHADDAVPIAELLEERRYLLDVANWMLGGAREAEGVIAEAYGCWYGLSDRARAEITTPRSWLARTVGGICLARLALPGSERSRAAGERAGEIGAVAYATLEREVGAVLLSTLDSLSPAERAAFVLSDVFGMAPGAVADIVGRSEGECAELAERARRSLRVRRSRPTTPERHDAVTRAVRDACVAEAPAVLASLLAPDAAVFFDGGGKLRALVGPVHGSERVARSLLTLLARHPRTTLRTHSVNGRTGLVVRYDEQVVAVITLDIAGHLVVQVWVVLNPDKLRSWNQPGTIRL
ncbi:sigma factor-like helix-turn-helix DNA-binding protein [Embleya sp. NPDC050493]|uniref:sigma factor-like helix-turn-helix DNA-binding protein n=1 Tax=Embleya sp. NPDC050493 TaxID=3363989 RepID=UPI0037B53849